MHFNFMDLNAQQQRAVEHFDGPIRIIAGAGTGKTRTLVERMAYLTVIRGVAPERTLALTFTNKAAHEMAERLRGRGLPDVAVMTFHALAARLLREFWKSDFKILSEKERAEVVGGLLQPGEEARAGEILTGIEKMYEQYSIVADPADCPPGHLRKIRHFYGNFVNDNNTQSGRFLYHYQNVQQKDSISDSAPTGYPAISEKISENSVSDGRLTEIFDAYLEQLDEKNAVDFTGLLATLLKLWEARPEVLDVCQQKFDHILVDEYQDVNPMQIEIMRKLSEAHKNICVVGDPDQTIYSWRGARAGTMKDFEKIFPGCATVTLEWNYRNPPGILKGAEALIAHNTGREEKKLRPMSSLRRQGSMSGDIEADSRLRWNDKIILWENKSETGQDETILHLLESELGSHSDMHMADELDSGRDRKTRGFSEIAILYRTQGEGKRIRALLTKKGYPCQMSSPENFWERKEIQKFLSELEPLRQLESVPEVKFSDWLRDCISNFTLSAKLNKAAAGRVQFLLNYAMSYDHLPVPEALGLFLDEARTEQEADNLVEADKINLLTLHAAKGLEFPVVMIVGLEDGVIPHKKSLNDDYWLQEERRLLYVGMTRATEQLHLFMVKKREDKEVTGSRFLGEIGFANMMPGQIPGAKVRSIKRKEIKQSQMTLF